MRVILLVFIVRCLATRVLARQCENSYVPPQASVLFIVHCLARDVRCDVDVRPLSWITLARQEEKLFYYLLDHFY